MIYRIVLSNAMHAYVLPMIGEGLAAMMVAGVGSMRFTFKFCTSVAFVRQYVTLIIACWPVKYIIWYLS